MFSVFSFGHLYSVILTSFKKSGARKFITKSSQIFENPKVKAILKYQKSYIKGLPEVIDVTSLPLFIEPHLIKVLWKIDMKSIAITTHSVTFM